MTQTLSRQMLAALALMLVGLGSVAKAAEDSPRSEARQLELAGKYAEAIDAFEVASSTDALASGLGIARCRIAIGERELAERDLETLTEAHVDAAEPRAELALSAYERGDYEAAKRWSAAARKLDDNSVAARWVDAELLRTSGQLEEAATAYRWFFDYYNQQDIAAADDLRLIGRAVAEHVRWNRLTRQFDTLVNDFYPAILVAEPGYWPAHYETGLLFLEKYNDAEAAKSFRAALKLNPSSAEVHAALARMALASFDMENARLATARAIELNPKLVEGYQVRADLLMANFDFDEAIKTLERVRELNPRSEETLGRLAACYILLDGLADNLAETRAGQLIAEVEQHNARAGIFYYTLATALGERMKFPSAERFYRAAIEQMPQLLYARSALGLMYMRMGREAEARELLEASFAEDPYHVRAKNMLEVLDVLEGFETIETEHFVVKFDPQHDRVLARYIAKHLEAAYPKLCQTLGYEPAEKSLFEIFNNARKSTGHQWFSARMVGLPYVGTVGACAGQMVALTAPTSLKSPFNWARVVEHEFVHVVNLQQTHFNIPHWYTEALAVLNEGYPRQQEWNEMLSERVPKGETFNLDTINLGFIRPKSGVDWQMAYCQAELYAEYMVATYGDDALAKMLAAYADNLDTRRALERSFGVRQEDFEAGYADYVKKIVDALPSTARTKEQSLAELQKAHDADPQDAHSAARLARAHLDRESYPDARRLARAALAIDPHEQTAALVVARLHLLVGDTDEALAALEGAIDSESPEEETLALLAGELLKARRHADATRWYRLAAERDAANPRWQKGLARVYLATGDDQSLAQVLERLSLLEADNASYRKKLAQLALADKNYPAAADWALKAIHVNVLDVDAHRMLAEALVAQKKHGAAVEEYEVAVELSPEEPGLRMALADACVEDGQKDKARSTLEVLIEMKPDYPGAATLLESLQP
ncbi:MAG: tetratricopeptide repeat protein [Pirellulales bacterium]|nr:tetratricopeptide repeat protein [Pirellulales bacterium]